MYIFYCYILFIYYVCAYMCVHSQCVVLCCGGQRTTCRSLFSSSTTWILVIRLRHEDWWQIPLPTELPCQLALFI